MEHEEPFYERLTAVDASFLHAEKDGLYMHVAGLLLFDDGGVCSEGRVDMARVEQQVLQMVVDESRLRQRLCWVNLLHHPYWVDDSRFRLAYHLRQTALPHPGDMRQLKRLMGRVLSQPLDRERPLWEMWIVEGLAQSGFAVILKLHHCMADGVGAMGVLARLVSGPRGEPSLPRARPVPSQRTLLAAELRHRRGVLAAIARDVRQTGVDKGALHGAWELLDTARKRSHPSPLNPSRLCGHRRFDTLRVPFDPVRCVKKAHGATVNDVVLAIVSGAMRRTLQRFGLDPAQQLPFRAAVPANLRKGGPTEQDGNVVGSLIVDLPVDEADPVRRLERVRHIMAHLKMESHELDSMRWIGALDDGLGLGMYTFSLRASGWLQPFNVIVTNVPGPPVPLKLFDAPLREMYGAVPLTPKEGLGIALFSYAGDLYFGLQADWDAIDDLHAIVGDLELSFAELCG